MTPSILCVPYAPGDEVIYTGDKKRGSKQVVTSNEMVDILCQYHSNPLGGHSSKNNTLDKIGHVYYLIGMKADVNEHVSAVYIINICNASLLSMHHL